MNRILIIEDEQAIRDALRRLLEKNGYEVFLAGSVEDALAKNAVDSFHLILSDLRLPGAPGTDIIRHAGGTPVLIMTSYASVRSAVDSMKLGAVDYIAKPFDHGELLHSIRRIIDRHALRRRSEHLQTELDERYPVDGMVGDAAVMRRV